AWIDSVERGQQPDLTEARKMIEKLRYRPVFSILMPCYETPPQFLREAIASVQNQHYPYWELCLVDDASPSNGIIPIAMMFAATDARILPKRRRQNGHISAASNTALHMAHGDWVVLMDHDDLLDQGALLELAVEINRYPESQIIYSDEDKIDGSGTRFGPYFKPDFDPDLLLGQNMISHMGAYRRDLLLAIGGFREGLEGSQDHDLALRACAACPVGAVRHIPAMLYHWRQQADEASFSETAMEKCISASRRAVADYLLACGVEASISPAPLVPFFHRVHFLVPSPTPKVSIIIPIHDGKIQSGDHSKSLLEKTSYPNVEVIISDNEAMADHQNSIAAEDLSWIQDRFDSFARSFTHSQLINSGVSRSAGDVILVLDPNTEVLDPDWLTEMVSLAVRPEIGAVGAKLLDEHRKVAHGGFILGMKGYGDIAGHYGAGAEYDDPGPSGCLALLRSVSAVSRACLAVRRKLYYEVGGLDGINLLLGFNDVDLCLKLREAGYRNVWTPFAELRNRNWPSIEFDIIGENSRILESDAFYMRRRWGASLEEDRYWNPHLSLITRRRDIATQSRRKTGR
ncbi:MAG: glycosyltransferase family 2 protein, partial [Roseomonas sp.]